MEQINGIITLSNGQLPQPLRIQLLDDSGQFPGPIIENMSEPNGNFMLPVNEPFSTALSNGTLQPRYKVLFQETILLEEPHPYFPGQQVNLMVDFNTYNQATGGGGNPPQPVTINGIVSLSNGASFEPMNVQLWDNSGQYGLITENMCQPNGAFSLNVDGQFADALNNGSIQPLYKVLYNSTELLQKLQAYEPGQQIDLVVDANAYDQATGGGGEDPSEQFHAVLQDIASVRSQKETVFNQILSTAETLKADEQLLTFAVNHGQDTTVLQGNFNATLGTLTALRDQHFALIDNEHTQIARLYEYFPFQGQAIAQMDDHVPILFFPVRMETVFQYNNGAPELWVRIFPDDIAVDTHEQKLTDDETEAGKSYWITAYTTSSNEHELKNTWDILCRSFGAERAAWITLQTMPTSLAVPTVNDLHFPGYPTKSYSWGKQPVSKIMPDRFVIVGYTSNNYSTPAFSVQTNIIPDALPMGIDPSIPPPTPPAPPNDTFVQSGGDIITPHNDVDWIIDFDAAIAKGLGKKIGISIEDYNQGYDRIIVLGVKASMNKDLSQQRLEELINSHHYMDGFSLLKQGTGTSNTDTEYSGYSSIDFGNDTTYATERKDPLFTPVPNNSSKSDGQMLCEALGIEYDTLYHIYHSDGYDIRDSMNISIALFQVAVGYYVGDMLHPLVTRTRVDELRDFFADYVRSRGALPSIRSGIQPYGILPASVYSRMNWTTDVYKDLYQDIRYLTATLAGNWDAAVASFAPDGYFASAGDNPNQKLVDFLARPALSVGNIQRLGFGPGYIWNNLVYASTENPEKTQQWLQQETQRMDQLQAQSGLPLNPKPRIAQFNFLDDQLQTSRPLVADENTPKDKPLPPLGGSGMNYMALIANASFDQLRDENYSAYGISDAEIPSAQLYQFTRQSLMLEYFDAACKLLNISDVQRLEPELINIANQQGEQGQSQYTTNGNFGLYTGPSRWSIMSQPYGGYPTVSAFLSSPAAEGAPQTGYLTRAKDAIGVLSFNTVGELSMLTTEVMDATCFRLDTWKLSMVNQRLNALRGIVDGNLNRTKGIYLGAYGWVENIRNRGARNFLSTAPTSNFTLPIEKDTSNKGFVQAPSISQAAAAAVLRSGFVNNGASSPTSPFSVNISSERTRSALQILEGIRNGQELAVLLGYEFERRLHDLYPPGAPNNYLTDQYIVPLREKYYLKNKIDSITPTATEDVKARNVVNGVELVNDFRANASNVVFGIGAISSQDANAIKNEAAWISNIMDATGDLTAAESVFQMVQGNQQRASAMTDAIARGTNIPEIEHINTPRTGLTINQKMTMHFELSSSLPTAWSSFPTSRRAIAEPYLNRWAAQVIGDPANIKFEVVNESFANHPTIVMSIADLQLQPLDLVYMIIDQLNTDDAELPLRIKRQLRANNWAARADVLKINYATSSTTDIDLADVLPILKYLKLVITNSRPLRTLDYVPQLEANEATQEIVNDYQFVDIYTRMSAAFSEFNSAYNELGTQLNSFTSPAAINYAQIRAVLDRFNQYGLTQTIYEFKENTEADYNVLKEYALSVQKEAKKRIDEYNAIKPADPVTTLPVTAVEVDKFISNATDAAKALFGREFNILPQFKILSADATTLQNLLSGGFGSLLNDHATEDFLMDQWINGIAKIKKNAANYELLTLLTSALDPDTFDGDRNVFPLQLPCAADGTERWQGASVNTPASLKDGRLSLGVSLPGSAGTHNITSWQVGILIEEWTDVVPNTEETTGIAFHFNQPNSKPPQCLLLGLTPDITGSWRWDDLVDMINETFTLAKTRAVTYEELSATPIAQLTPSFMVPFSANYSTIGFAQVDLHP